MKVVSIYKSIPQSCNLSADLSICPARLATNAITIALYRTRLPPRKAGPLIEWTAFKELPYSLYCTAMFFNFWVNTFHELVVSKLI